MLFFNLLNAASSSGPHSNFTFLSVSFLNGAVIDEYLSMNFDKYPTIPRKLLTASFVSGRLLSLTALSFSAVGFNACFVNQYT